VYINLALAAVFCFRHSWQTEQNTSYSVRSLEKNYIGRGNVVCIFAYWFQMNGVVEYFPGLFVGQNLVETALALNKTMATDNISTQTFYFI
jgi:hypothetical protein